jgi:hypothetical protein
VGFDENCVLFKFLIVHFEILNDVFELCNGLSEILNLSSNFVFPNRCVSIIKLISNS